jgi:hypothetical protein
MFSCRNFDIHDSPYILDYVGTEHLVNQSLTQKQSNVNKKFENPKIFCSCDISLA